MHNTYKEYFKSDNLTNAQHLVAINTFGGLLFISVANPVVFTFVFRPQ